MGMSGHEFISSFPFPSKTAERECGLPGAGRPGWKTDEKVGPGRYERSSTALQFGPRWAWRSFLCAPLCGAVFFQGYGDLTPGGSAGRGPRLVEVALARVGPAVGGRTVLGKPLG